MILSFADKSTEDIFDGLNSKQARKVLPVALHIVARKKLDAINKSWELRNLKSPPGNNLEALKGDLKGYHSIRINDQFRIVFKWERGNASEVKITDYH